MTDAPETIWVNPEETVNNKPSWIDGLSVSHKESYVDDCCEGIQYTRTDTIEGLKSQLDTALKLLRDNQMQWSRELNQAELDLISEARKP
jgi:GH25 family lysozyme M1 (1,4-beta-N-acetylmuramidase)